MALRVVLFSDTHLGFDYPTRRRKSGVGSLRRGEDFFANFETVLDYAQRERPDVLVHAGDLFHRSEPHPAVVDRAYQGLIACADSGVPVVVVPGNHERSVLPPSLFLRHPNIHIVSRPTAFPLGTSSAHTISVAGFPYEKRVGEVVEDLLSEIDDQQPDTDYKLLCFHHAVEGCTVGAGAGTTDFTFRHGADVIPAKCIPAGYDLVMSGHIHRAQFMSLASPMLYCGSVERTSFAEWREDKSFCDIRIPSPGAKAQINKIKLPSRTMRSVDGQHCSGAGALESFLCGQLSTEMDRPMFRVRAREYLQAEQVRGIESRLGCTLKLQVTR